MKLGDVLKTLVLRLFVGANVATLLLLSLCGLSSYLSPESFPRLSMAGLVYPLFLLFNLLFIPFWLVFHVRYVWVPLAGLLLNFPFIRAYCPLNLPRKVPEDAIKVLTYNIHAFGESGADPADSRAILDYLLQSDADIVCLQEAYLYSRIRRDTLEAAMQAAGYHTLRVDEGPDRGLICFSRFPALSVSAIPYPSETNASMLCQLLCGGDTLYLLNNHFESNKLTQDDKAHYKEMLTEPERGKMESGARLLMDKMSKAAAIRAVQVDSVAACLRSLRTCPVVLCGDFNDSPISYTCQRLTRLLTSAYEQSGNGPGISYNQRGFYVRIDHILFSDAWESYGSCVDKSIAFSDHYPLYTYLKRTKK